MMQNKTSSWFFLRMVVYTVRLHRSSYRARPSASKSGNVATVKTRPLIVTVLIPRIHLSVATATDANL